MPPTPTETADVCVIGAGPAGAVAAMVLARAGVDVLVVDSPPGGRQGSLIRVGESLAPEARPLLEELGLTPRLQQAGHRPSFGNHSAWGSTELACTDFIYNPYGSGWHVDREAFDRMLLAAAEEAGARVWRGARCLMAERQRDTWQIDLDGRDGGRRECLRTRWVLDCSGRRAVVARHQGARRRCEDRLVAVAWILGERTDLRAECHVDGSPVGESTTTVESVPSGWWYTSPLPHGRRVLAYLTDGDLLDVSAARSVAGGCRLLSKTRYIKSISVMHAPGNAKPTILAAGSSYLTSFYGDGWVAAGDAAASFDPLSSQGLVTAMATGRAAATAILNHEAGDGDAMAWYAAALEGEIRRYMRQRTAYYGMECRWPDAPFWQRRHVHFAPA